MEVRGIGEINENLKIWKIIIELELFNYASNLLALPCLGAVVGVSHIDGH